jgi:hypothetical protein
MKVGLLATVAMAALLSGCAQQPPPLTTPAPVTGLHGESVSVPANIANSATNRQRDAYFDQLMVAAGLPANLASSQAEAHKTCDIMSQGKPPIYAIGLAVNDGMPPQVASATVYNGVLAYCPQFRAPFDQLGATAQTSNK